MEFRAFVSVASVNQALKKYLKRKKKNKLVMKIKSIEKYLTWNHSHFSPGALTPR